MRGSGSELAGKFRLRLYIAGASPSSGRALSNLRAFCDKHLGACPPVEVVDVVKDAKQALADGVIVTPTLVRLVPAPPQKIVGDLSDEARLRAAFELPVTET